MADIRPLDWGRTGAYRAVRAYNNARRTATWEYLTYEPMRVVWRFLYAMLGGWLAMGAFIFIGYDPRLTLQRLSNSLMVGLTFGVMIGFLALFAGEYPARLQGLWPTWKRVIVWGLISWLWAVLTWGVYHFFLLNNAETSWTMLLIAGFGLAIGFLLTAFLKLSKWVAVLLTVIGIYLPIYASYQRFLDPTWLRGWPLDFGPVMFFRQPGDVFILAIPFVLLIALGGHWGLVRGGN